MIKRTITLMLAFLLVGPPAGLAITLVTSIAYVVAVGQTTHEQVLGALGGFLLMAPFAYLVAGLPALLAGAAYSIVLPFLPTRLARLLAALPIGFASTFAFMAFRPGVWDHSNTWPPTGSYQMGAVGAAAAACSVAVIEYFTWLETERSK
jgi:hypothetical protein